MLRHCGLLNILKRRKYFRITRTLKYYRILSLTEAKLKLLLLETMKTFNHVWSRINVHIETVQSAKLKFIQNLCRAFDAVTAADYYLS